MFFVFDQFEEYFLYNPVDPNTEIFEAEFSQAVNRRDLNANFLLSMREDSLSKLDRFQGRIPTLMNNMLRLEHLDRGGAKDAIVQPLDEYNRRRSDGQPAVTVEPNLVELVLDDLRGVKATPEHSAQMRVEDLMNIAPATEIETPLLQMVMTRLWDEERAEKSSVLRVQTFEKLGRAANIARTHLDTIMDKLNSSERDEAASVLRYMVTPAGTKIAQEAAALASWTELPEEKVQAILTRLSGQDVRILRTVQAPGQPRQYEIFHDVLAQAILNWRRRYVAKQQEDRIRLEEQKRRVAEQAEAERRSEKERGRLMWRAVIGLSVLLLIAIGMAVFALVQRHRAIHTLDELNGSNAKLNDANAKLQNKVDAIEHVTKGAQLAQQQRFVEAVAEYDKAIESDPDNLTAYSNKGYAFIRLGFFKEAIQPLQHAIDKDPSFVWGHYNLAQAYWEQGDRDRAVNEVAEVLKIDPNFKELIKHDPQFEKFTVSPAYLKLIESSDSP